MWGYPPKGSNWGPHFWPPGKMARLASPLPLGLIMSPLFFAIELASGEAIDQLLSLR